MPLNRLSGLLQKNEFLSGRWELYVRIDIEADGYQEDDHGENKHAGAGDIREQMPGEHKVFREIHY